MRAFQIHPYHQNFGLNERWVGLSVFLSVYLLRMGMFAERNLRYPEDRERLARALKSREAFEAFIVSGAGMLDFDGARRGQLGAAAAAADADDDLGRRRNLGSGADDDVACRVVH